MGTKFRRCTAAVFFKFFRQFPGDAHLCLGSDFNKDVEGFQQAMRRLKVDACFATRCGAFSSSGAGRSSWAEIRQKEGISWNPEPMSAVRTALGPGRTFTESRAPDKHG
jgi:hypothetical protein